MARLTPTTSAMACMVCCRLAYICRATASLAGVSAGGRAATDASSGSCGAEAGHGAVADQVSFEFGKCAEQMKHEFAGGGRGVNVLGERPEADLAVSECRDGFDEVAKQPAEPVEPPHDERVARPQLVENLGEFLAVVECPGRLVGEHAEATDGFQSVALEVGILVERRDTRVAEEMATARL